MGGRPERGLFQIIFKHFVNSLKPRRFRGDLVGTDHFGTKYYEMPRQASSEKKSAVRYFESENKEKFDQEIPAEWEAWLRYRRKEPPSESEVLRNRALMNTKKKNAAELDGSPEASTPLNPETPSLSAINGFPIYKDYQDADPRRPEKK